ncbi:UNKNOWN [Stylonychia lemnae]|uniref:Uncharacterized protein n=1 Tax=Stylonychia lemnae TaxID=5949 RepID=A0A078BAJ2_STYLE|nr:UNKNOWN [Stylonychia lemnae]|eukprot:CDW91580.1 UNKNOWN [Stylonychia lemnae]
MMQNINNNNNISINKRKSVTSPTIQIPHFSSNQLSSLLQSPTIIPMKAFDDIEINLKEKGAFKNLSKTEIELLKLAIKYWQILSKNKFILSNETPKIQTPAMMPKNLNISQHSSQSFPRKILSQKESNPIKGSNGQYSSSMSNNNQDFLSPKNNLIQNQLNNQNNDKSQSKNSTLLYSNWKTLLKELAKYKYRDRLFDRFHKYIDGKLHEQMAPNKRREQFYTFIDHKRSQLVEIAKNADQQKTEQSQHHLSKKFQEKFKQMKDDVNSLKTQMNFYNKVVQDIRSNSVEKPASVAQPNLSVTQTPNITLINEQSQNLPCPSGLGFNRGLSLNGNSRSKTNLQVPYGIQQNADKSPRGGNSSNMLLINFKRSNVKSMIDDIPQSITIDDEFNILSWFLKTIIGFIKERQIIKSDKKENEIARIKVDTKLKDDKKLNTLNEHDISDENNSSFLKTFDSTKQNAQKTMGSKNESTSNQNKDPQFLSKFIKTSSMSVHSNNIKIKQNPRTQSNTAFTSPRILINQSQLNKSSIQLSNSPNNSNTGLDLFSMKINLANVKNVLRKIIQLIKKKIRTEKQFIIDDSQCTLNDPNLLNLNEEVYHKIGVLQVVIKLIRREKFQEIIEMRHLPDFNLLDLDSIKIIKEMIPQIKNIFDYKKSIIKLAFENKRRQNEFREQNIFSFDKVNINGIQGNSRERIENQYVAIPPQNINYSQEYQLKGSQRDTFRDNQDSALRMYELQQDNQMEEKVIEEDQQSLGPDSFRTEKDDKSQNKMKEAQNYFLAESVEDNNSQVNRKLFINQGDEYVKKNNAESHYPRIHSKLRNNPNEFRTQQQNSTQDGFNFKARPYQIKFFESNFNPLKQPFQRKTMQKLSPIKRSFKKHISKNTYITNNTTNIIFENQQNITIINQNQPGQNSTFGMTSQRPGSITDNFNEYSGFSSQAPITIKNRVQSVIESSRKQKRGDPNQLGYSKIFFRNQKAYQNKVYTPLNRGSPTRLNSNNSSMKNEQDQIQ